MPLPLVISSALDNLTPFDVLMHVGIGASSFLTLSQLGAARFGIMPLINSQANRSAAGITTRGAVSAWNVFFSGATVPVVAGVVLSTTSYLAASYYVPNTAANAKLSAATRSFLYITAAVSLLPLPYTIVRLGPNIRAIQSLMPKATLTAAEEAFAWKNINSWYAGHHVRVGLYAAGLLMGLAAYNGAPKV